jgi:hypothetical protein
MSLARILKTTLDNLPDQVPYLMPPKDGLTIQKHKDLLRVGIVWAGKPSHKNDKNRSAGLKAFTPIFDVPGIEVISLQMGEARVEMQDTGIGTLMRDVTGNVKDFADTASLLRHVDLIITVDTSIAHLAGALARPVWVLLPFAPDWRWLQQRDDSPWYPSMTLFRQTSPDDWPEVFHRVRQSLFKHVSNQRP